MTISNYALVENGTVTNIILWDGESEWAPPAGAAAVLISAASVVEIGYTYDGVAFSAPVTQA